VVVLGGERINTTIWTPGLAAGDGADSTNGLVTDTLIDACFEDISFAVGVVHYYGVDATNKASNATKCEIYLKTHSGGQYGAVTGESVRITDGTHTWRVLIQEDAGNPFISFIDTDCRSHGPASYPIVPDYSAAAFRDSLEITVENANRPHLDADQFTTDNTAPGALTGAVIKRSATSSDTLDADLTTAEADLYAVAQTGAGGVKAGVVGASAIAKATAFSTDSLANILKDGSCERYLYGTDITFGWEKTAPAATTYWAEGTIVKHGTYSQGFDPNGSAGVGCLGLIQDEYGGASLRSKVLTITGWVYVTTTADNVAIGFYDDQAGYQVDAPSVAINTWTWVSHSATVDAAATDVKSVIRSATGGAGYIYFDRVSVNIGSIAPEAVNPSIYGEIVHHSLDNRFHNYIPDSDLYTYSGTNHPSGAWLDGASAAPWPWSGAGTTATIIQDTTDFLYSNASMEITWAVGQRARHIIGLDPPAGKPEESIALQELLGKPVTFSVAMKRDGAQTEDLDVQIVTDGTGGTTTTKSFAVNDFTVFDRAAVTLDTVPADATYIYCDLMNNGAAQIEAFIDGPMLTQTKYPTAYTSVTGWKYYSFEFIYDGSVPNAATPMITAGAQNYRPIIRPMYCYGLTVYEDTQCGAVGPGDTFTPLLRQWTGAPPWVNTNLTTYTVTIDTGTDAYETKGGPGYLLIPGSLIGCEVDGDPVAPGQNATAIIHCVYWGP
jgi:hypothetical protein